MLFLFAVFALSAFAQSTFQPCPIQGPAFLAPTCISRNEQVWADLRGNLTAAATTRNSPFGNLTANTTYSLQVFSLDDPGVLFEWSLTPEIVKNGSFGTKEVDGDTITRVGSVSKLISVYTILVALGDKYWNTPVTDVIPELSSDVQRAKADPLDFVQWDEVTLGMLASHLHGTTRDFERSGLDLEFRPATTQVAAGFPPLPPSSLPPCLINTTTACTWAQFFANLDYRQPIYAPSTTPTYSNTAWGILGYAIESITGAPFSTLVQDTIFTPLNMTSSSYFTPPNTANALIPTSPDASFWNVNLGSTAPAGNMYSTSNDLIKLARSILNSTLLSPRQTRAWLKPHSLLSSLESAVGMPWEIFRTPLGGYRIADAYTKSGELGAYTANLVLYPEYNIGWVGLAARSRVGVQGDAYELDAFATRMIPQAMEEFARRRAEENISGIYAHATLNSSLSLTTREGESGVLLTSLVSNSTPVYGERLETGALDIRLYPTNLKRYNTVRRTWEVGYRSVSLETGRRFSSPWLQCFSWFTVDAGSYGPRGGDQWVIEFEGSEKDGELGRFGRAVAVVPRWLEARMERLAT